MGFDEGSARAAIIAAGGDVDRAVRIVLEDSRAHNARSLAEWEFEGDMGWAPFDSDSDVFMKDAVHRGESSCELRMGGHRYLIDFESLTQHNLATKRTRRIRRRQEQGQAAATMATTEAVLSSMPAPAPEVATAAALTTAAASTMAAPLQVPSALTQPGEI